MTILNDVINAKNLVQSWMYVEENILGIELKESVDNLNTSLKTNYTASRIWEWSRCENKGRGIQIKRTVRRYMGKIVLPHALEAFGLNNASISKIDLEKLTKILN